MTLISQDRRWCRDAVYSDEGPSALVLGMQTDAASYFLCADRSCLEDQTQRVGARVGLLASGAHPDCQSLPSNDVLQ